MHAGIAAIMKMMSKQMLFSHVYQASSSRKWFHWLHHNMQKMHLMILFLYFLAMN